LEETVFEIENDDEFIEKVKIICNRSNKKNTRIQFEKKYTNASNIFISNSLGKVDELVYELFPEDEDFYKKIQLNLKNFDCVNEDSINLGIFGYKDLIKSGKYKDVVFKHIINSIGVLAIKRRSASCKEIACIYKKGCENLINLISNWVDLDTYQNKVYLMGFDLSFLNLSGPKFPNHMFSLRWAWFNNTKIISTNFSNLDLSYCNFDNVKCSFNSCFQNTCLKGTTFRNANLIGVNKNKAGFINGMNENEAGEPFLQAKSLSNAKIEDWLREFLKQNGKEYLLYK
jgi:uncharacterized protein YjbI with pentapeptide repeats